MKHPVRFVRIGDPADPVDPVRHFPHAGAGGFHRFDPLPQKNDPFPFIIRQNRVSGATDTAEDPVRFVFRYGKIRVTEACRQRAPGQQQRVAFRNGFQAFRNLFPRQCGQMLPAFRKKRAAETGERFLLNYPAQSAEHAVRAIVKTHRVSDGVIAPGYSEEALAILKPKKKGGYNIVQIDPDYVPGPQETKEVFGVTFEQGHNVSKIGPELFRNIVTKNKELPPEAMTDLIVALITLKYTQSNSVCYVKDGQAIGVGAGQQSRIHCTRLAGQKADNWYRRRHPKVLGLQFVDGIRRPDRDNAIDVYISDEYEDVLAEGAWQQTFKVRPEVLTREEKKAWIATQSGVTCGSDAFFPFGDNVERARKSGVKYIAEPGGSVRDDDVIDKADKYGMVMAFTGLRLFHH